MVGASEKVSYENIKYLSGEDSPSPLNLQTIITEKLKSGLKAMKQ